MCTQRLLAKKSKMWSKKGKKISYSPVNWSFIRKMKPFLGFTATYPCRKKHFTHVKCFLTPCGKECVFLLGKPTAQLLGWPHVYKANPEHVYKAAQSTWSQQEMNTQLLASWWVTLRFEYKSLKLEWVVFLCKAIAGKKVSQLLNVFLLNRHFLLFSEMFLSKTTWWEGIYI